MLFLLPPNRLYGRFFPHPLPPAGTYDNKTVLVTGGTSGLGLAAAHHFVNLGAHVVITCRAAARGENAKKIIEAATGSSGKVTVMELDMTSYASCVKLVDDLKDQYSGKGGIDLAVLNAGCLGVGYVASPEGWEETLQVNTLSTTLLGLLFVDWMKEERAAREDPAHIVFVTSRDHLYADNQNWAKYAEEGGILQHFNNEENWPEYSPGARPNYAETKLFLTYAIEGLSDLARGPDGEPQVLINAVCPGCVKTEIGRQGAATSWIMKVGTFIFFAVGGKTPDYGARIFIQAATRPKEEHGRFWSSWLGYEQYLTLGKTVRNVTSPNARNLQKLVWAEISSELSKKVPIAATALQADGNSN